MATAAIPAPGGAPPVLPVDVSADSTGAVPGRVDMQTAVAGNKKRKSKGIAARGPTALPKNRGSGFEEYYAEPPLTVDEFEEEMDLYHMRIETSIQRYRARRRLDNDRTNLFNRYLSVGGIDCTPRQFNGAMGMHETEGMTASEKKTLGATDIVSQGGSALSKYYVSDNSHLWAVDFSGVVSGFFSVSLRNLACSRKQLIPVGIDVVDNFMRYLQIHDVCPEYDEDIKAARAICTQAHTELPNCFEVLRQMPGQFNRACTKLFWHETDSSLFHGGLDPLQWAVDPEGNEVKDDGMENDAVFRATVALQKNVVGPTALAAAKGDLSEIRVVSTKILDLEIASLVTPSDEKRQQYAEKDEKLRPAGIVISKHYCIEAGIANQPHPSDEELAARGMVAFFLDATTMEMLTVGMKLRVVMHELSCDLNFVSAIKEVLPSFYMYLPQELMTEFKEPDPNEREAPSEDMPNADDDAMADAGKDE
ncbi:argonaute sirna chaperone complex subunit arb1 [Ophiostoma piceae UAMH 11346]|uniref:Argonaute sirna chaperone complex subunit arb1 n=1 Tax=Ophiostoma piceae (strain UAMH 11346) TaxID=1262450 RepID=S3D0K3_OPHP1|nr:argonaute sirna chaperone complex subunit arb1 [Ophiostoma piceae UAMH 11346]